MHQSNMRPLRRTGGEVLPRIGGHLGRRLMKGRSQPCVYVVFSPGLAGRRMLGRKQTNKQRHFTQTAAAGIRKMLSHVLAENGKRKRRNVLDLLHW